MAAVLKISPNIVSRVWNLARAQLYQEAMQNLKKNRLEDNQKVSHYVIVRKLGAGGMGEVYLAQDTSLDRTVALKILPSGLAADKRRMQRFEQEARVVSSLNQPNILTIFEFGEADSLRFIATEYVEGETLRDYKHGRQLKLQEIIDISVQILAALDAAHEAKIVHRDIKPENVMIRRRDRIVKVLDFGLAKLTEKGTSTSRRRPADTEAATEFKTAPGSVMGTVNYMSPEQAQGHPVDERTDLWSTGVMIYEMVSGAMPFKGVTSSHTIVEILEKDPKPLTQLGHVVVTPEFERIVRKAMAKNPDERYQSARDMMIDLRSLRRRLDVEAEIERSASPDVVNASATTERNFQVTTPPGESSTAKTGKRGTSSHKKLVLGSALALVVVVVGAVFVINVWRSSRARPVASAAVAVAERSLSYWVTVQKYKDKKPYKDPFPLAADMNFEPDYHIRLNVRSPQSGYLYILNEGPPHGNGAPQFVVLFPSPTANKGSGLVPENREVQIPGESWITFDKEQGTERLWLVFSANPVGELDAVKAFANSKDGGLISDLALNTRVQEFLKTHSATKPTIGKSDEQKETTLLIPGDVLVHVIRLEHH